MELVTDNYFKKSYELYYGDIRDKMILESINNTFSNYDPELVTAALNIIKTSAAVGFTYTECYDKVIENLLPQFPLSDDIDKFILSLTIKLMIVQGSSDIEKLMKSPRDINREVAAKHFRIPYKKVTEDMIKLITEASDNFTKQRYAIIDPPVESWDEYFYNVSRQVARNSKCLSRRIGTVLAFDKSIISTGYNGPPRGVPKCDLRWKLDEEFAAKYGDRVKDKEKIGVCPRQLIGFKSGTGLEVCIAGHAERNALINAVRNGVKARGASLYMTCGIPCTPCLVEIINAGVKEIIVTSLKPYDESSMYLMKQSDLGIRLFDFIK